MSWLERTQRLARRAVQALGLSLALDAPLAHAQAPGDTLGPWRIVILNNADFLLPASTVMDQALRETLIELSPRPLDLYGESLDSFRYPGQIEAQLVELLRKKHAGHRIDLVMARGQAGFDFAMRNRSELWPTAPIVFYNNLPDSSAAKTVAPNTTGVLIELDPWHTVELVHRLHPGTRHLFVVGGSAPYDLSWKKRLQSRLDERKGMEVTWLDDLPLPRILEAVGRLPPRSLVLYTSMMRDAQGLERVNPQVAQAVASAANAPVYAFLETTTGGNVVGGNIADFAAQGRAAARLALRVLTGEPTGTIPVQASPPGRCVLNAGALDRWGIDESRLPAQCEVRARPASLWRDYRWQVIGAVLAILLQAALIAGLLFQWRRRRAAETEASDRRQELTQASRLALGGEISASIAHEINQPLGAILANTGAAEAQLRRPVPDLEELRQIVADIRKDDLRASDIIHRIRALLTRHEADLRSADVNEIVAETLLMLEPQIARRGVVLQVSLSPSIPRCAVDRVHLQQALINLCMNAMDAMAGNAPERRLLSVATSGNERGSVEIVVGDRGHGIAAEQLPRLFDSFFTTKTHGMGLGLSITRSIAESHHGDVFARNRTGGGAEFVIVLPDEKATA